MTHQIELVSQAGGLFACLVLIHMIADWFWQTHTEAMIKHKDNEVRAKHCLIYTAFFTPWFAVFHFSWWQWLLSLNVLFYSHYLLDTYAGVYMWARYIRRPPEMNTDKDKGTLHDPKIGFVKFAETPLGKILSITIDQLSHILVLWVIVVFSIMNG
jgi:hypothetical protein